ncbi:MAG: MBL fold metallo-hydrolase [Ruminococcus sp.]|nr:MBL fold metallo-hydrolase [Ruminococcus sp.]
MRMCSIASGSSGNCIYIGSEQTHLLVDTGISKKRIDAGLKDLEIKGEELKGILVTHEHSDHIQGLGVFSRKYKVPIYATQGTIEGIQSSSSLGKLPEGLLHPIQTDQEFLLGDLLVHPFSVSHDANAPCGYRITCGKKAAAVATDLGKYDAYVVDRLQGLDAVLLEANHDVHMLEVGGYPYYLKRRILGERGHLSNELSGRLLCDILHDGLQYIVLGHLSRENNYPRLAYETVKLEVTLGENAYRGEELNMTVAKRDERSEILSF